MWHATSLIWHTTSLIWRTRSLIWLAVAALYLRRGVALPNFLHGGGQESGRRAGTESVLLLVALGEVRAILGRWCVILGRWCAILGRWRATLESGAPC
eukprot:5393951-Prymnesium_polylepis.1